MLLPEPETPVTTMNGPSGNAHVDALEVVLAGAAHDEARGRCRAGATSARRTIRSPRR